MKKAIQFSKLFPAAIILSAVLILSGIVSIALRGINFGLDFKPGMIEEIRIAPTVMELSYTGSATVNVDPSDAGFDVVISGIGAENRTIGFAYADNATVGTLASKINQIEGVNAKVISDVAIPAEGLFVNSAVSTTLTAVPLRVHASDKSVKVDADDVRNALKSVAESDVKALGTDENRSYQIRMGLNKDANGKSIQSLTSEALENTFGADRVAIVKSDFIGAQFSKSLIRDSILLVLCTLVLIWIYATIRFHWDFALAAVIAIIHDSLIMVSFVSWSQMEFSTTTLAAILTIIGYSINATVVILDRVRSDIKLVEAKNFVEILNSALTGTLGRSIITTVTTLFAVLSLYFFTTGTIHDFALALTVGLISGCYSSIFISSAFIAAVRKNHKFTTVPVSDNVIKMEEQI